MSGAQKAKASTFLDFKRRMVRQAHHERVLEIDIFETKNKPHYKRHRVYKNNGYVTI